MNVEFTTHAWEEFCDWAESDENLSLRIKELIKSIRRDPFQGIGKPEPLKFNLKGL
jgi:toxin YoeB